jgi:hypothetical protein
LAALVVAAFFRLARRTNSGRLFEPAPGKGGRSVETGRATFDLLFILEEAVAALAGVQWAPAKMTTGSVGQFCHGGFLPGFGFIDSLMNGWPRFVYIVS